MERPARAIGIVIKENQLLLIRRNKGGKEFYVFPGGSVEKNESIEEAVVRELEEETTVKIKIGELLYHHDYGTSEQLYYLCDYISGEPKLGESIEKERTTLGKDLYEPLWVDVDKTPKLLIYPLEIRDWFIKDYKNDFQDTPRKASLKTSELRES